MLFEAAHAGDPELRELVATLERERLVGAGGVVGLLAEVGALRPGLSLDRARDIVWTMISPEVCRLLVAERGWSLDEWEASLATSLADALLGPEPAAAAPSTPRAT